jgi:hypothetical protein
MFWQTLERLNVELPFDIVIPVVGVYPGKIQTYPTQKLVHKCSYSFTIGKRGEQPKCPSTNEWIVHP